MTQGNVEIIALREPFIFDDNFQRFWNNVYDNAIISKADHDAVEVKIASGQTGAALGRNVNYNTSIKYIVFKAKAVSLDGNYFRIQVWLAGVKKAQSFMATNTNIHTFDVNSLYSGDVDEIRIAVYGAPGNYVQLDFLCVCNKTPKIVTDDADLEGEMRITQRLIHEGACSAVFSLNNSDGSYDDVLKGNDIILINLAKLGETLKKEFGGRIEKPIDSGLGGKLNILTFNCTGHGVELITPPELVQNYYKDTNGKTIISAAVTKTNLLAEHPNKFFNCHTNCNINSLHTAIINEEEPINQLRSILEKAKNGSGTQGFDASVLPSGCVVGHLRNSSDHLYGSTVNLKKWVFSLDFHRIITKQKVYGAIGKANPTNRDTYTDYADPASHNWNSDVGGTFGVDTTEKKAGARSITHQRPDSDVYNGFLFDIYAETGNYVNCMIFKKFHVWVRIDQNCTSPVQGVWVRFIDKNDDSVSFKIYHVPKQNEWLEININLGPEQTWPIGTIDWRYIQKVKFEFYTPNSQSKVWVDNMYFEGPYAGEYEDLSKPYVKVAKPITDESLVSDAECLLMAESIVKANVDPLPILQDCEVEFAEYNLGDKIVTSISLVSYRLLRHTIRIVAGDISSTLSFSAEPTLVNLVFKKLFEETLRFDRRSRGT